MKWAAKVRVQFELSPKVWNFFLGRIVLCIKVLKAFSYSSKLHVYLAEKKKLPPFNCFVPDWPKHVFYFRKQICFSACSPLRSITAVAFINLELLLKSTPLTKFHCCGVCFVMDCFQKRRLQPCFSSAALIGMKQKWPNIQRTLHASFTSA